MKWTKLLIFWFRELRRRAQRAHCAIRQTIHAVEETSASSGMRAIGRFFQFVQEPPVGLINLFRRQVPGTRDFILQFGNQAARLAVIRRHFRPVDGITRIR
jgi:hypothetical protein